MGSDNFGIEGVTVYQLCTCSSGPDHSLSEMLEKGARSLGYPNTMYQQIIAIDLEYSGLSCTTNVELPAKWGETTLARYQSDHILVADKYLLNIRSVLERPPPYEFIRTRTYLGVLGLQFGFVVNFGKKQLQIYGIQAT